MMVMDIIWSVYDIKNNNNNKKKQQQKKKKKKIHT